MEGYGHMLVVAVGVNSQQGIITSLIQGTHRKKAAAAQSEAAADADGAFLLALNVLG
jgi:hypothetical protein